MANILGFNHRIDNGAVDINHISYSRRGVKVSFPIMFLDSDSEAFIDGSYTLRNGKSDTDLPGIIGFLPVSASNSSACRSELVRGYEKGCTGFPGKRISTRIKQHCFCKFVSTLSIHLNQLPGSTGR